MKKLKDFSYVIFLLLTVNSFAQFKLKGVVTDNNNNKLRSVEVYNKTNGNLIKTDSNGNFELELGTKGTYELAFYLEKYVLVEKSIDIKQDFTSLNISLDLMNNELSEVVIYSQKEKLFSLRKLKDIEETAIYAGKKTEVISIDKLTVNKATNNARQVFSQVVGLTINEGNDGGLQLNIGGRGLNPNRTSNFNTRQNGYDISADVLGYPESYYTTPVEALEEIQVVRGAASLQYGTQFGGMVNFKLKSPSNKPIEFTNRITAGSFGLLTDFTSLSGKVGKFSYYTFYNQKQGSSFRPNSEFDSKNYFANLNYQFTEKTSVHFDYTHFNYLAQQPGGLTDVMFNQDPEQSNRERNWFKVNWNLYALKFKHKVSTDTDLSLLFFGLDAERKAIGFRTNRVSQPDDVSAKRDLIVGDFKNWGTEARLLKKYQIKEKNSALLLGLKYYHSNNASLQGFGTADSDADFNLAQGESPSSDYTFPNKNAAFFGENLFKVSERFTITPGFRLEHIITNAKGNYRVVNYDNAGNVIFDQTYYEDNSFERNFALFGLGFSFKPSSQLESYANISQNFRSITFNDIRIVNPSAKVDEKITDEKGFTADMGIRGKISNAVTFDSSLFALLYEDRIGEVLILDNGRIVRYRTNIGQSVNYGAEFFADWNITQSFFNQNENIKWNCFANLAITQSKYLDSQIAGIKGNQVEFVPLVNLKTGMGFGYKNFLSSLQFTYLTSQFTDASNAATNNMDNNRGIEGQIPMYYVVDFSTSYKWKNWKLESGINNVLDRSYFTRRATGYPGPGIIPSDPRSFYVTLGFNF